MIFELVFNLLKHYVRRTHRLDIPGIFCMHVLVGTPGAVWITSAASRTQRVKNRKGK